MLYLPEIIIATILLLGVIIYILNKSLKYKKKKRTLLIKFRQVREKSLSLQNEYYNYIVKQDALNTKFREGLTYGQFLNDLKRNHVSNLSEKKFIRVKSTSNLFYLNKMTKVLDEQEAMLEEIEEQFMSSKK